MRAFGNGCSQPPSGPADGLTRPQHHTPGVSPVLEVGSWASAHAQANGARPGAIRVALYSHDTMGLGHARRNLLLAQALSSAGRQVDVLLITGNRETSAFRMPPGTDCLTIPSIYKATDGSYRAHRLDMSLQELVVMRANLIRTALESFQPDVFIVDNVPRGAARELDPALRALRQSGRTQCVLGLRDILDAPAVVKREWHKTGNYDAVRQFFDRIWVFGDASVYDPVVEYAFPADIAARVRYAGYLDQRARLSLEDDTGADPLAELNLPPGKLALCMVGGGQDGSRVAEAFAQAHLPEGMHAVVITGPFMPEETRARLRAETASNPRLRILDFIPEPGPIVQRADRVVAMGGYNTVCEVLSYGKRALIVPRVSPREEQAIRARRLSELGLIDTLHPDALNPARISAWLSGALDRVRVPHAVDLNGMQRLPGLLDELLTVAPEYSTSQLFGQEDQYVAL